MRVMTKAIAIAALLVVAMTAQAWAAGIAGLVSTTVGASGAPVDRCDQTPNNWRYDSWSLTADGLVSGVTVSGLDAACNGATARITLTGTGAQTSGSGMVTSGAFSAAFPSGAQPGLETVEHAYVVIVGP